LIPEERREINRPGGGLYPEPLKERIDEMNAWIQRDINKAVYDVAAAKDQVEYNARISTLFSAFDRVEDILAHSPFLLGDSMTETDIRLFTSVVRFDTVYYGTMHCSKKMVRYDYPKLHVWMQRLYWDESELTRGAFRKTTDFSHVSFPGER
jgi:putative glutathione S-transferase